MFPELGTPHYDNALEIRFSGGYSMFIDPFGMPEPTAVLCHECAHAVCAAHPWLETLLDPAHSHAHLPEHHPRLVAEGHQGWDLPVVTDSVTSDEPAL